MRNLFTLYSDKCKEEPCPLFMTKALKSVCWFSVEPKKHGALEKALNSHGFEVHFEKPPTVMAESSLGEWLTNHLSKDTAAIIADGENLKWLDILYTSVRALRPLGLRFAPILWAYEKVDQSLFERVISIGINDLFSLSLKPVEIALRLELRIDRAEAMRRLQRRLDEQNKRDAATETAVKQREEFLSVCTHDLRSPIGLIQSSLGMLLDGDEAKNLSPLTAEVLSRSRRQAGNAIRLVNDLLDVMSFEQGLKPHYELFSLHEFLTEFYEDYKPQVDEKGIALHYNNPIAGWQVLADSDRVRQLLQNLLTNAIKFTDSGKNIFITVTPFQGRRRSDPPYPMLIISFKDEGQGIPEDEVERIFDRFSQIKDYSRAGGRGLGLTVAKQISRLHAGNLWVESREGKGSTFNVLLPHVISRTELKKIATQSKETPNRILIVEPCEEKRKKQFAGLAEKGFELTYVKDGVETVAMAFHSQPDIVLLRHDMHKMGEEEVANILKSHEITSHMHLFLGLDKGESSDRVNIAENLVEGMVSVPVDVEEFTRQINESFRKHRRGVKVAA